MKSDPTYNLLMHILVGLGVLAFGVADDNPTLLLVALPLIPLAWVVSSGPDGEPLPRWLINALLIGAVGYLAMNLRGPATEYVSALATFLTAIQIIKLFDLRAPRDHGQILSLSVMLVIGACLTSVTVDLGAVLILYAPLLLVTTTQHHLWAGQESARRTGAEILKTINADPDERTITGRRGRSQLVGAVMVSGVAVTAIGVLVFMLMPRGIGGSMFGQWRPPTQGATIAFKDHVQLGGASGLLSESPRIVMEVAISHPSDRRVNQSTWRLRGAILDTYRHEERLWVRSEDVSRFDRRMRHTPGDQPADKTKYATSKPYTIDVAVRNRQADQLFTVWMPRALNFPHARRKRTLKYSPVDGAYLMDADFGPLEYQFLAYDKEAVDFDGEFIVNVPEPESTAYFRNQPRIRGLAIDILEEWGRDYQQYIDDAEDHGPVPNLIEQYLQTNYDYVAEIIPPVGDEDPIEMFLFHPDRGGRGHCEYFASAMAALCQSVGVNSRIVTGYVTSEYLPERDIFLVRESNAHAWVEAEIAPGVWKTFDPSPPDTMSEIHRTAGGLRGSFRKVMDAIELAWVENVIRYDEQTQAATFGDRDGDPLGMYARLEALAERLGVNADARGIRNLLRAVGQAIGAGAVAFAVFALLLFLTRAPLDRILDRLRALIPNFRRTRADERHDKRPRIEFYERLLNLLERAGCAKPEWRPPLAHAATLEGRNDPDPADVERITRLYYAVRFGGVQLSEDQRNDATETLARIEARLNEPRTEQTT